ncbi:hypothetical protein Desti_4660 [Desulfomonile tiedjei DSM 6799]|uniref:Uncharacterized protein n=1 Tax=Desulfomonile tiedjei (strain ATCC 49306 / DSM 6799 / DCB-1) TaxID=706587 RepID=I4CCJ2_DESTA|nr:hypothetical protein Desti_4660 [Desulfomonile tiedjei DSM 6799]
MQEVPPRTPLQELLILAGMQFPYRKLHSSERESSWKVWGEISFTKKVPSVFLNGKLGSVRKIFAHYAGRAGEKNNNEYGKGGSVPVT